MYWIGPPGPEEDAGGGTDFDAIRRNYISVTPIHVDLTRYQALEQVGRWIKDMTQEQGGGSPNPEPAQNQPADHGMEPVDKAV